MENLKSANMTNKEITRYSNNSTVTINDNIAVEKFITIYINDNEHTTMAVSPSDLPELIAGLLLTDGLIKHKNDILSLKHDTLDNIIYVTIKPIPKQEKKSSRIVLSGCGKGTATNYLKKIAEIQPIKSTFTISTKIIFKLVSEFSGSSQLYADTGGVHSAALVKDNKIVAFYEDISRHNAIDKLLGGSLLKGISLNKGWVITSGRISSDLIYKLALAGIELVTSKNSPTSMALDLAEMLQLTTVGFVRGKRLNIYTFPNRITP